MSAYAIDNYLLDLIRHEVQRAANADADFASTKAQRAYGLQLIRSLPGDIDWRSLEASFLGVNSIAPDANLQPEAIVARLVKQWREEQNALQLQAGAPALGLGR